MTQHQDGSIRIAKETLRWFLPLLFAFLGWIGVQLWNGAASLTSLDLRLAAVENRQAEMQQTQERLLDDVGYLRRQSEGPLRSEALGGRWTLKK